MVEYCLKASQEENIHSFKSRTYGRVLKVVNRKSQKLSPFEKKKKKKEEIMVIYPYACTRINFLAIRWPWCSS